MAVSSSSSSESVSSSSSSQSVSSYLDVKMHIDEVQADLNPVPTVNIATIEKIKVTQIFDRVKRKDIDRIHQHPFFHE